MLEMSATIDTGIFREYYSRFHDFRLILGSLGAHEAAVSDSEGDESGDDAQDPEQELQAAQHKALQRAEFDRLDMLAQQEARAKVREGQMFGHALEQLERLKAQLRERSDGSEEIVRLLHAHQAAEEELEVGEVVEDKAGVEEEELVEELKEEDSG